MPGIGSFKFAFRPTGAAERPESPVPEAPEPGASLRAAIVVVHGVSPTPRYATQDRFATALQTRLSERAAAAGEPAWDLQTTFAPNAQIADPEEIRTTFDRVLRGSQAYDVIEAYWSPLDKNRTTVASAASWILNAIFVPLNDEVPFPGSPGKIAFDVAFVVGALILMAALAAATIYFGARAFAEVVCASQAGCSSENEFLALLAQPTMLLGALGWRGALVLAVGFVGAVLIARPTGWLLYTFVWLRRPARAGALIRNAAVIAVGILLLLVSATWQWGLGYAFGASVVTFVWAVLAAQGASAIGRNFLVNFLGDVQIYTTHDENSEFFALRESIRTAVERVLLSVLQRVDGADAYYDRVYVAGHSLGSTIAMDAILRIHELHEGGGLADEVWSRLRALITYGTALEKTKYFFDSKSQSFSAAFEQWQDDLNGHLFTPQIAVLASPNDKSRPELGLGIYWGNFWYERDIVANRIETYRSDIAPRFWTRSSDTRIVCRNALLPKPWPQHFFPHQKYVEDPNFWTWSDEGVALGVLDVLTRR